MKTIKQHNAKLIITFLLAASSFFTIPLVAQAASNKIDLEAGFYTVNASASGKSGNVSGVGLYHIGYRRAINPHFDVGLGYTVLFTKVITGDSGFGLDINGTYYFLGASNLLEASTDHTYLAYSEDLRPFVSAFFAQRNYQSIQTSYAGFGGGLGVEKNLAERLSLRITGRYNMLSAGQGATAKEMSFLGGIVIEF